MPSAMPWAAPMITPTGIVAAAGIPPLPTEAPSLDFRPLELLKRSNVQFPPPDNWCGFVDSLYDDALTCSLGHTCVNSGTVMGCCTAATGECDALYTTCLNDFDTCDAHCLANPGIKKCDAIFPFCATYSFARGIRLYSCQLTSAKPIAVEFLNDFYITAIGSTIGDGSTAVLANNAKVSLGPLAASGSGTDTVGDTVGTGVGSAVIPTISASGSGLSTGAIGGIAAGCTIGGITTLVLIAFFCFRRRRRMRINQSPNGVKVPAHVTVTPSPLMQQQQQMQMSPATSGGYQSVPQHEVQHSNATEQNRHHDEVVPNLSHHQSLLPPPNIREVDATMGNPGTTSSQLAAGHPSEVDSTLGNPSVPVGGHGISLQRLPGGSPSSIEIDGQSVQPSSTAPFTRAHYIGHDRL